jgi:hypothetical protein
VSELTKLAMIRERLDPIFYLDSCPLLGHVLFQANQIGRLIGIINIRASIDDYDADERILRTP